MATNTSKPVSTAAIRQRIEELQARRREFMKCNPPRWISKPKIMQHVLGAEMVSLSRDSDFGKIPAELQLHVISYMDYPDVLKLKQTCRYFSYFINADVLRDSRQYQIELFKVMEDMRTLPDGHVPCYSCLRCKPTNEFYNITTNQYYGSQGGTTYYYNRTPLMPPLMDFSRSCIRCNFLNGFYDPGLKLTTGNQEWMFCGSCGHLVRNAGLVSTAYNSLGTCKACTSYLEVFRNTTPFIRLFQFLIAVVILPLACTGQAMPWSSTPDSNSLRWIFTVTLTLLTIGATFVSWALRAQSNYGKYNHKRTENNKFVAPVEITACACWIGCLVALFNDGRRWHFSGRWDRFAKGLAAMMFIECLLFILTALWSTRLGRRLTIPGTRRHFV